MHSNERPVHGRGEAASEALVAPTLDLFARWLDRDDRDDLLVALDGLSEMNVRFSGHDQNALRYLVESPSRMTRRQRAHTLAPIVWTLVHQANRWRPSTSELRRLLALALRVRQQVRDPGRIVGGERGQINLIGLLWWAGRDREPGSSHRIRTIARFVEDGDAEAFKQNLLSDFADAAQRRRRNDVQRSRRERLRQLRVYSYDSGDRLEGTPTRQLIRASANAGAVGAVPAYRDSVYHWQYVPPQEVDFYRRHRHVDVITVYVA